MRPFLALLGLAALAVPIAAHAGPPFVTDDPEPVDYGHWEINNAVMGRAVAGGTQGSSLIDANYGALPGLQLHVQPQLAYIRTPTGSHFGIGDTELGVKYRFVDEDEDGWRPMVSLYPLFEIPTGSAKRGLGTGVGHSFLPIWAQKTVGDWTVYGGAGYGINPGADGKNAWFAGGVALYRVTEAFSFGGETFLQTAQAPGEKDSPGVNLGGSYDLTETYHLLFSAGRGLANADTTDRFATYLALQITF